MKVSRQLWILTGGNGAGKTTFYNKFLAPKGIKLVNADVIAKAINPDNPENVSNDAANIAEQIREELLLDGVSFCFETVFSHVTMIDFVAKAKTLGYQIILIYIHLDTSSLNEARVYQRVCDGGHDVPVDKIHSRIPRTMNNIAAALPLVNEARLLNNSSRDNPFLPTAIVRQGRLRWADAPLPEWAEDILINTR
ncbi:MAG: dephospho-CoA kinase [Spirochaetales bacterium]|jgi:predicted ABC-type ATPase|nr:dephospho-CoA kinase [Spirochaetales bacterium]